MKRSIAELITRDPEKFAHHDRVFKNNPVVMQGMGLAPLVVEQVFKVVSKIRDMGVTVLLVEQNANMALGVCDRAYIMSTGLITGSGRRDELLTDERLVEAYLGQKK